MLTIQVIIKYSPQWRFDLHLYSSTNLLPLVLCCSDFRFANNPFSTDILVQNAI